MLHVANEDIAMHLFIETLVVNVTDWFNHLELGIIISWVAMSKRFLARFKLVEDSHLLFS